MIVLEVPVFRALAGRFSSITNFTLPTKVTAGEEIPFAVAGHLSGTPTWANFAVGFFYIEGPMAEITLIMDGKSYTLRPGAGVAMYMSPRPSVCTTISLDCKIKTLDEGSYKFCAVTGYVDTATGTFYYDDRVDRTVEVAPAAVWPWWILPIGGGVAVVAIVGGVVWYQERRREEMMLLAR